MTTVDAGRRGLGRTGGPGLAAVGLSAVELARALDLRPPTSEQAAVIEAPPAPCLVVAGAGSGKTETMAARVVWLVANGLVAPEAVLGLTFTRKAAGELANRVRLRLGQLRDRQLLPAPVPAELLAGEPTVLTYHAYAARIVGEHALRVPVEPSVQLLSEARTWQLAEQVVRGYDGDLPHVGWSPTTVVDAVLALAAELAEHLREPAELREWTAALAAAIRALPRARGQRSSEDSYAKVRELLDTQAARVELLPLVERYVQAKRQQDGMDFGDQMALAARIADRFGEVGGAERARYGAVLLDEYQDTGHAQRVLLRALFGAGHPVTAVGDPCQSIYGWRGASAGNLARFPRDFPVRDGVAGSVYPLTLSFRNGARILAQANRLAEPLRAQRVAVPRLRAVQGNPPGAVICALHRTVVDEAEWVADLVAEHWEAAQLRRAADGGRPPTAAVLVRRRAQIPRLEQALRARQLPVEVVGLGGLLDTPEVADLVATLAVLYDPTAGPALVRLLAGARWRIGPRDLDALGRRAAVLAARRRPTPESGRPARPGGPAAVPDPDAVDDRSLVEALDSLGPPAQYSAEGYQRLARFGAELAELRARTGQPLADLVADLERTLGLGLELAARPDRPPGTARAHLDRFLDVAADFAAAAEVASLGAFLAYLDAAAQREDGLQPGTVDVEPDRVQLLTVHGAKGLEWDLVAVPGLTSQVFPVASRGGDWTRDPRALPAPLRGDADDLPQLDLHDVADQQQLDRVRASHQERCAELGALEERRLAYVAATRARHTLLCSGYWWDDSRRPRGPSCFLTEVRESCLSGWGVLAGWAEPPEDDEANPLLAQPASTSWPLDPLGARRSSLEEGAALVQAALAGEGERGQRGHGRPPTRRSSQRRIPDEQEPLFDPAVPDAQAWASEAELLLAERGGRAATEGASGGRSVDVPLPAHLSVTALVTLHRDAAELARQIRRPMPFRPAPLTRRGTAFHAWLEQHYGGDRLLDLDELPGAADEHAAPDADLAALQDTFLTSEWAHRRPAEVEVPFETSVAGIVLRGRVDAVFADEDGGWTVVDWKTGGQPTGAARQAAEVQLAAYRLAWADLTGSPVGRVRAAFHYVRDNCTVRPADLLDATQLRALIEGIPAVHGQPEADGVGQLDHQRPMIGQAGGDGLGGDDRR